MNDNLQNAFDRLIAVVGRKNAVTPAEAGFVDFLRDETYLQGDAALVLRPGSQEEIGALLSELHAARECYPAVARELVFTLRGGGSGLSGAAVPTHGIVLDLTRVRRIIEIDETNAFVRAECGITLAEINAALGELPFFYAVDPSSSALCSLGGSIATNAAGPSSLKYGTTRQNLAALRFFTVDGRRIAAGALPHKTSMGFSLPELLCGSEGRLGIIVEADLRLTPRAEEKQLVLGAFADEAQAIDFIVKMRSNSLKPKCIEIVDGYSMQLADFQLRGGALLMIEFDGTPTEVTAAAEKLTGLNARVDWVVAESATQQANLWAKRKSITGRLKERFAFKLGEDIAVPLSALAHTAAFARQKAKSRGVETAVWGHAGDGNLHVNYLLDSIDALPLLDILMRELAVEVTRVGGAVSGEHGLGRLKRKYARAVLAGDYFDVQKKIKTAFDPACILNPALEAEE